MEYDKDLKLLRADGGWNQLPELESDAYATGQALFALHSAGKLPAPDAAYASMALAAALQPPSITSQRR